MTKNFKPSEVNNLPHHESSTHPTSTVFVVQSGSESSPKQNQHYIYDKEVISVSKDITDVKENVVSSTSTPPTTTISAFHLSTLASKNNLHYIHDEVEVKSVSKENNHSKENVVESVTTSELPPETTSKTSTNLCPPSHLIIFAGKIVTGVLSMF